MSSLIAERVTEFVVRKVRKQSGVYRVDRHAL